METNLTEIDNESICPEGWRLYDGELRAGDPCPVLSYMGNLYVPKSRGPRKITTNVYALAEPTNPVWTWGDDAIVEVTEVRE